MEERIAILENEKIISQEVACFIRKVLDEYLLEFSDKKSALEMLITHLAMATQRVCVHAEVEKLDDAIWDEVTLNKNFIKANDLFEGIQREAPCMYPEGEKRFIIMHLCNLFQL